MRYGLRHEIRQRYTITPDQQGALWLESRVESGQAGMRQRGFTHLLWLRYRLQKATWPGQALG